MVYDNYRIALRAALAIATFVCAGTSSAYAQNIVNSFNTASLGLPTDEDINQYSPQFLSGESSPDIDIASDAYTTTTNLNTLGIDDDASDSIDGLFDLYDSAFDAVQDSQNNSDARIFGAQTGSGQDAVQMFALFTLLRAKSPLFRAGSPLFDSTMLALEFSLDNSYPATSAANDNPALPVYSGNYDLDAPTTQTPATTPHIKIYADYLNIQGVRYAIPRTFNAGWGYEFLANRVQEDTLKDRSGGASNLIILYLADPNFGKSVTPYSYDDLFGSLFGTTETPYNTYFGNLAAAQSPNPSRLAALLSIGVISANLLSSKGLLRTWRRARRI